ncbi:hypothetical protein BD324DRAFT_625297 [Kockovaella imperatae]|uniref:Uncharacterized protein n=1 Tax=Kockovaella imperatae TaxID=4999 RepID=A0A1Y1UIA1_9TREE|nr:hypothetical protein BD324DRAFT_625297 [Kockovaella imperatae]ORX37216.1 hypothetical protein BD324DRAFT_625297 [Kockovaella imperatae]
MGNIISAIARGINAVFQAIVNVLTAIVSGIANVFIAIWNFITCGACGGRRRGGRGTV